MAHGNHIPDRPLDFLAPVGPFDSARIVECPVCRLKMPIGKFLGHKCERPAGASGMLSELPVDPSVWMNLRS